MLPGFSFSMPNSSPRRSRLGARLKMMVLAGSLCCLVAGGATGLFILAEQNRLLASQGAALTGTARIMAERLDAALGAWARDVVLLSRQEVFEQAPPKVQQMRWLLEDLKARSPEFSWIGFASPEGRILAATGGLLEGAEVSSRPWFGSGLRAPYLGDVHPAVLLAPLLPSEEGGENAAFVDAAAPVRSHDGTVMGVVAGHLNWRWAEAVRQEVLRLSGSAAPPELLVLSGAGQVLLGPEALIGKPLVDAETLRGWTAAREGDWHGNLPDMADSVLGYARTAGTTSHSGLGWTVVARQHQSVVLAPMAGFARPLAMGGIAIGLLAALTALLTGGLTGRLRRRIGLLATMLPLPGSQSRELVPAEAIAAPDRLRNPAYLDPLTGLLNPVGLEAWRLAQRAAERSCAVLALELDGFRPLQERHGTAAADAVLQAIAYWLKHHIRGSDVAARTGGGGFVLVLHGPPERSRIAANEVAARLDAMLRKGLETRFGHLALSCSIGSATVPQEASDLANGLATADAALNAAKQRAPLHRLPSP
jgi:diguanylate cyclase (GGDEF)-like protein